MNIQVRLNLKDHRGYPMLSVRSVKTLKEAGEFVRKAYKYPPEYSVRVVHDTYREGGYLVEVRAPRCIWITAAEFIKLEDK